MLIFTKIGKFQFWLKEGALVLIFTTRWLFLKKVRKMLIFNKIVKFQFWPKGGALVLIFTTRWRF